MGIPQYFGWLSRKYDSEIIYGSAGDTGIDHFYFDFNCLIYHCYAKMDHAKNLPKSLQERQSSLIDDVLKYTKYVIDIVKPKKSVSICIDGVVPMAKMHQQRLRRYKSPIFKEWENNIKKKYGVYQEELLDTNQITPGTPFMNMLCESIEDAIKRKYFGKVDIKFSGANSPGEGEHKVLAMIREMKIKEEEKICIYGLDADLIMLALTLVDNKVWLIRENVHIGKSEKLTEFLYVSVENLGNLIFNEITNILTDKYRVIKKSLSKSRIINDYVFLGFLLGNDFLHHIPSLSIQHNGVDYVINLYASCINKVQDYLLSKVGNKTQINNTFLKGIFESLEKGEESSLKYLSTKKKLPSPPNFDDHYSEEKWKWDRVPFNPMFEKCYSVMDYRNSGWKKKYYSLFFEFEYDNENDKICLENICRNYFEGMTFVARYYFDGGISWKWYNPYNVCPFASDLNSYLMKIKDINAIKLEEGTPYTPFEQLMMVLPKRSSSLLPECLEKEMMSKELEMFYPETFEWVAWEKMMLYSVEPKLPEIDIEKIREVVRRVI